MAKRNRKAPRGEGPTPTCKHDNTTSKVITTVVKGKEIRVLVTHCANPKCKIFLR